MVLRLLSNWGQIPGQALKKKLTTVILPSPGDGRVTAGAGAVMLPMQLAASRFILLELEAARRLLKVWKLGALLAFTSQTFLLDRGRGSRRCREKQRRRTSAKRSSASMARGTC